jgi:hypothetical protein
MPPLREALRARDTPGSPSRRADQALIIEESCADITVAENLYHSRGFIIVKVCDDPWFRLTRDTVQEAFGLSLDVPLWDIMVDFYPNKGFLVLLPSPTLRDRVLTANFGVAVGRAKLQLLSWTRMAEAEAVTLPFKIRLYIEGIPNHACQPSIIKQLLPKDALFECIDFNHRNDNEA